MLGRRPWIGCPVGITGRSFAGVSDDRTIRPAAAAALWMILASVASAVPPTVGPGPTHPDRSHTPAAATAAMAVRPGYDVTLIAHEPLVIDPVAARWDDRGRLWVVEMPDYPTGPRDNRPPAGRIKILSDHDGDGVMDSATLFADQLLFPTGVQPYRDGAIVTLAGNITQFVDEDDDGIADASSVLLSGFATENEQLRANHPVLGPDGWIYVAGGLRGGKIVAVDPRFSTADPIDLNDRDLRLDLRSGRFESVAGSSQFGLSIDDFNRRIGCSNRNPAIIASLSLATVRHHPWLSPRDAVVDVSASGEASLVRPISDAWTTSNLHAGQFSAACGVSAVGQPLSGDAEALYVCEPTGSLVQRQTLSRSGGIWRGEREDVQAEFLASTDTWFRPVDLTPAPGGSLLVVDMARAVIEHPDWVPDELKNRSDTWHGDTLGRIWKVTPQRAAGGGGAVTDRFAPTDDDTALLDGLDAADPVLRELAGGRLIQMLDDIADTQPDRSMSLRSELTGRVRSPLTPAATRSRCFWLLDRYQWAGPIELAALLTDADPRLRQVALQAAIEHPRWAATLLDRIETLGGEPDPGVVVDWLQAFAGPAAIDHVGQDQAAAVDAVAGQIALALTQHAGDRRVMMVLGGLDHRVVAALTTQRSIASSIFAAELLRRQAHDRPAEAWQTLRRWWDAAAQDDAAASPGERLVWVDAWMKGADASAQPDTPQWSRWLRDLGVDLAAWEIASDARNDTDTRSLALGLLTRMQTWGDVTVDVASLRRLFEPDGSPSLQSVAVELVSRVDGDWARQRLIDQESALSWETKQRLIDAQGDTPDGIRWVIDCVVSGRLPKTIVREDLSRRWSEHPDEDIRRQVRQTFASDPDRTAVLATYAKALDRSARVVPADELAVGKKLFSRHCSSCHRIDGVGVNVGPDISDSRTKTPDALLAAILDPNAAIDASYLQTVVLTEDGQILDGLLIDKSDDSITLLQKSDKRVTISRDELVELRQSGVSLMPTGFEQSMTPPELNELIRYLKNWRY